MTSRREAAIAAAVVLGLIAVVAALIVWVMNVVPYPPVNAIDTTDFESYYQERLQNLKTPINNTALTATELQQVIENQRGRAYEAYNLEWFYCDSKSDSPVEATNARNWVNGTEIKTEIVCVFENGDIRNYRLDLDALESKQEESIILETKGA